MFGVCRVRINRQTVITLLGGKSGNPSVSDIDNVND